MVRARIEEFALESKQRFDPESFELDDAMSGYISTK